MLAICKTSLFYGTGLLSECATIFKSAFTWSSGISHLTSEQLIMCMWHLFPLCAFDNPPLNHTSNSKYLSLTFVETSVVWYFENEGNFLRL